MCRKDRFYLKPFGRDQGNEIEIEIEQWNYGAFITPLVRIWKKFDAVEISRNQ